jgi:hypothetical protein
MMLVRDVIDLLRHTSSTFWMLSICCSEWRLKMICWGTWLVTYLSFIDISCDVLLEAYLLDILVHSFGIWMSYILGHVVDELIKWSCYTPLMISYSIFYGIDLHG